MKTRWHKTSDCSKLQDRIYKLERIIERLRKADYLTIKAILEEVEL